ncbi:uncharacterized protein A4U43_C10F1870 [Asparagus officinalis]|uniref:Uncharacterized protein n=1 Tax=Asparagus officinalis TaxID=4686 RepID=A0A5P1E4B6_ASPOF|nr:uncharacterized protein LOC109825557 isoform X2 [Asparagus officinalis]ONK55876.1 uncharacterized protein A4U43_C10F1870 [Asparagus officinalis]
MSRCFPFPPPNYRREEKGCSLTQSIKLQRDQETAKERRKEKKREKKDRKEKRDKSKDKCETSKHREHGHKKRKHEEIKELQMNDCYQQAKADKVATEQLEKSELTEEHELPSHLPQEPCDSSESTQNSSKSRKLEAGNISSGNNGGTVLRLRLPLRKHNDQKPTSVNNEPCFSGRTIETPIEQELCNNAGRASSSTIKSAKKIEVLAERKMSNNANVQLAAMTKSSKITESLRGMDLGYNARSHSSRIQSCKTIEAPKEQKLVNNALISSSSGIKNAKKTEASAEGKLSNTSHSRLSAMTKRSKITEAPRLIDLGHNAHSLSSDRIESCKTIEAPAEQKLVENAHIPSTSESKSSKRCRKMDRKFSDLIDNLKPAPLLLDAELGSEDLGWLFEKPCRDRANVQSSSTSNAVEDRSNGSFSSCFQPKACYLPEFEMYRLPYTIPF